MQKPNQWLVQGTTTPVAGKHGSHQERRSPTTLCRPACRRFVENDCRLLDLCFSGDVHCYEMFLVPSTSFNGNLLFNICLGFLGNFQVIQSRTDDDRIMKTKTVKLQFLNKKRTFALTKRINPWQPDSRIFAVPVTS